MTDKPQAVILAMGTEGYFNRSSERMCADAPPHVPDAPALARFDHDGHDRPVLVVRADIQIQQVGTWSLLQAIWPSPASDLGRSTVSTRSCNPQP